MQLYISSMEKAEGELMHTQRRQCVDGGRDRSDLAAIPVATRGWERQGANSPLKFLEVGAPWWLSGLSL